MPMQSTSNTTSAAGRSASRMFTAGHQTQCLRIAKQMNLRLRLSFSVGSRVSYLMANSSIWVCSRRHTPAFCQHYCKKPHLQSPKIEKAPPERNTRCRIPHGLRNSQLIKRPPKKTFRPSLGIILLLATIYLQPGLVRYHCLLLQHTNGKRC